MQNERNKIIASIVFVLILTASSLIACMPTAAAQKTNISLAATLYPIVGINSPTFITWMPTPNPFLSGPYAVDNMVDTPRWSNATITFTRPDGSQDVKNGPFTVYKLVYASGSVGFNPRFEYVYTPTATGNWSVTFYWPGDDTYNSVNVTNTFTVGPHFEKRDSWCLLSIRPYPNVGQGQEVLVNAFVTPPPVTAYENFKNFKFTIKRADNSVYYTFTTDTEAPGVMWFNIYPDTLGNWSMTMEWAGNYFYKPCSITRTFIVQAAQIPYPVPDTPLPTDYWAPPVNVYNRLWRLIAGPWLQPGYNASLGSCNEYTEAPRTAHIVWKIGPINSQGGYIGAYEANTGITTSNIYTSTAASVSCVMAGRGYYAAAGNVVCVDMRTGQTLWTAPGSAMSKFGLPSGLIGATRSRAPVLYYFGNQFIIYDAITGAVTLNVTGLPWLLYSDPYVYSVQGTNWIKWTTAGTSTNFTSRIVWNVSDPYLAFPYSPSTWPWNYLLYNDLIVYGLQRYGRTTYEDAIMEAMVARNATTGELVYVTPDLDLTNADTWPVQQGPSRGAAYGLYYYPITGEPSQMSTTGTLTTGGYIAFNVTTGKLAWYSAPYNVYPWGCFHCYNPEAAGYGLIFDLGYAGIHALNASNGKVVWYYTAGNSQMETPYNTWPFGSVGAVVGGGVLFAPETEHSPTLYYRGNTLKAVDAFTGKEVWDIMGYYTPSACAYGTLLATETPSGYSYAFSKGQTATTVSVTKLQVAKGETVGITGTIMDQSPAQPNTPCVSKDSMTGWMEYLHMQQPKPTNATGVPVKLSAIKSDGSKVDIAQVTSNAYGTFTYQWNPKDQDTYTIVATFSGDDSYYSSEATATVNVGPVITAASGSASPTLAPTQTTSPSGSAAPTTSPSESSTVPPTTSPSESPTASPTLVPPPESGGIDMYLVTAIAIIVVVAAVIGVFLLRRRSK